MAGGTRSSVRLASQNSKRANQLFKDSRQEAQKRRWILIGNQTGQEELRGPAKDNRRDFVNFYDAAGLEILSPSMPPTEL